MSAQKHLGLSLPPFVVLGASEYLKVFQTFDVLVLRIPFKDFAL